MVTQKRSSTGLFAWLLLAALVLSLSVTRSVNAQTILTEGFESTTFPPTGWTRASSNASYPWARVSNYGGSPSVISHGGSHMARYHSYSAPSGSTAELRTPALNFSATSQVVVTFWMYRESAYTGYTNEKVDVYVNTSNTSVGGTLLGTVIRWRGGAPVVSANGWYQYSFNVPSSYNGSTNYIIFKATSQYGNDMFIDDVNIYNLAPCTGPVSAGTISPSGTQTVCPGSTLTLQTTGYGLAANTIQQWQYYDGSAWQNLPGATSYTYTTFPITASTRFRFINVCSNTGDTSFAPSSAGLTVNLTGGGIFPNYASLPFFEDFENWTDGCSSKDIPGSAWTNSHPSGNSSWRRDDQGSTGSWSSPNSGRHNPAFYSNAHSARFHSYYAVGRAAQGSLSCYVNCSAVGNKELEFYMRTDPGPSYPKDSMHVEYSTDGGMTWNLLVRYGPGTGGWDYHGGIVLPSTSATTVVRFTASQNYGYSGYSDMYIDAVRIFPPCAGNPVAGIIDSVQACAGKNFTLKLAGTSAAAGLTYLWQYKPTGSTVGWSNLPGGNVAQPTANISSPTTFRAIVTCSNSSMSDTSAELDVPIAPFYYCYCSVPTSVNYPQYQYGGIGNVTVSSRPAGTTLMSNGNPLPATNNPGVTVGYKSFAGTVPAPVLIRDSTYRFSITTATSYSTGLGSSYNYAVMFLDINRNGVWDLPGERIMTKRVTSFPTTAYQDYTIPSNAPVGLTGLRAISGYYLNSSNPPNPCGSFYYQGSAEDYLVYIQYQPCDGPTDAGTAYISDTSVCPGYTVDLWDTSYQKDRTGISRMWEVSTNLGASYSAIPGSANKDTMANVIVPASSYGVRYRLRAICSNTGDTTYSNWLNVTNPPAGSCYPFASALPPGTKDSSDIGSFTIGSYVNPQPVAVSGPHLMNPAANRRRTSYTNMSPMWTLAADSTYRIAVYHTMRSAAHADALVSVFIDFNHDGQYSVGSPGYPYPPELVFRGISRSDSFYLDSKFTMPSVLIGGVPTGLRVVLNNDLDTTASDNGNDGKGGFVSGEVEDYLVLLTRTNLGVGAGNLIRNLALFPNPTSDKATVVFDASRTINRLELTVTTITGETVLSKSYDNVGRHFASELNLSGKAKGIYFVELKADDGRKVTQKLVLQ